MTLRIAISIAWLSLLAACAVNPVTGRRELSFMSEAQEISIGQQSDPQIKEEMGVYNDADLQAYVNDIGQRMAKISERPNLPWRFTIVDVPAVNAFAVPGGFIYITRGIMPFLDNEAELAGVIGHEIGHVTARHSAQQYTRQVSGTIGLVALGIFVPAARPFGDLTGQALGVLFLRYGRDDELQADELGARYEATLGWDPAGVPAFLSTLGKLDEASGNRRGVPNWLSTHPEPLARVEDIQPTVEQLKAGRADFSTNRDAFMQRIDGILYGDNPEQGIARGGVFLHPVLRFRIDFPDGWEIANSPRQVVAKAPGADVFMLLQLVEKPQGRNLQEIALNSMANAGFRAVEGARTTIGGLDSFVGVYQGQIEGMGRVASRAAHIAYDGKIYLVAGLVAPETFRQADAAFSNSIRSFRSLTAAEAENINPNRVDLYVVRAGDTWASIAERGGGVISPATLAVMNNATPGSQPQPGTRIKIVVGG
ncbi:MAG: M48 family metalloprotease [Acidobacteria bacterium]|nr:M48 family metalloprotease [Acidobacteriota bacterium]